MVLDGGAEAGKTHAGGMAVGDLLKQDGIASDPVPVNLQREREKVVSAVATASGRETHILEAFLLEHGVQDSCNSLVIVVAVSMTSTTAIATVVATAATVAVTGSAVGFHGWGCLL